MRATGFIAERTIAQRDFRKSRRYEIPLIDDIVRDRRGRARQRLCASAPALLRRNRRSSDAGFARLRRTFVSPRYECRWFGSAWRYPLSALGKTPRSGQRLEIVRPVPRAVHRSKDTWTFSRRCARYGRSMRAERLISNARLILRCKRCRLASAFAGRVLIRATGLELVLLGVLRRRRSFE